MKDPWQYMVLGTLAAGGVPLKNLPETVENLAKAVDPEAYQDKIHSLLMELLEVKRDQRALRLASKAA